MSHEIGHTLGMGNVGSSDPCGPQPTNELGFGLIMSGGWLNNKIWSNCSRARFEAYYQQNKDNWCMEENAEACVYTNTDSKEWASCIMLLMTRG